MNYNPSERQHTSLKIVLGLVAGVLLLIAIQHHWVTACFNYFMSMMFDKFEFHASTYIPDIVILIIVLLSIVGIWHMIQYFLLATVITVILVAILTYFYINDTKPTVSRGSESTSSSRGGSH